MTKIHLGRDISEVDLTGIADKYGLLYDQASGLFKPGAVSQPGHTHPGTDITGSNIPGYYTATNLQTSGSAQVHYGNITNRTTLNQVPLSVAYEAVGQYKINGGQQQSIVNKGTKCVAYMGGATRLGVVYNVTWDGTYGHVYITGGTDYTWNAAVDNNTIYFCDQPNPAWWVDWFAYTPTWTTDGTAPAIGNGTLKGFFNLVGSTCTVHFMFSGSTTTTYGTGNWFFNLPIAAANLSPAYTTYGNFKIRRPGTYNWNFWGQVSQNGTTDFKYFIPAGSNGTNYNTFTNLYPHTWTSGDWLDGSVQYRI